MMRACLLVLAACGSPVARSVPPPSPAPATAGGAPCFADQPVLRAHDIYKQLEKDSAAWYRGDEFPPPHAWGTCTVARGQIVAADGALVAELSCGVRVVARGIVDELGIEIGALGKDVLARRRSAPLQCLANGPGQARCRFERPEGADTDSSSYVVAGDIADDMLSGDAATAFFAERPIVEMLVSIWCH